MPPFSALTTSYAFKGVVNPMNLNFIKYDRSKADLIGRGPTNKFFVNDFGYLTDLELELCTSLGAIYQLEDIDQAVIFKNLVQTRKLTIGSNDSIVVRKDLEQQIIVDRRFWETLDLNSEYDHLVPRKPGIISGLSKVEERQLLVHLEKIAASTFWPCVCQSSMPTKFFDPNYIPLDLHTCHNETALVTRDGSNLMNPVLPHIATASGEFNLILMTREARRSELWEFVNSMPINRLPVLRRFSGFGSSSTQAVYIYEFWGREF